MDNARIIILAEDSQLGAASTRVRSGERVLIDELWLSCTSVVCPEHVDVLVTRGSAMDAFLENRAGLGSRRVTCDAFTSAVEAVPTLLVPSNTWVHPTALVRTLERVAYNRATVSLVCDDRQTGVCGFISVADWRKVAEAPRCDVQNVLVQHHEWICIDSADSESAFRDVASSPGMTDARRAQREPYWIGVDLDGTLAFPVQGDRYPGRIGNPNPHVVQLVQRILDAGVTVKVFTARVSNRDKMEAAFEAMSVSRWTIGVFGRHLDITCTKDLACIGLIDDISLGVLPDGSLSGDVPEKLRRFFQL